MSRYIDADAVEKIINDIRDCISVDGYWAILQRLKKIPTADVVEVVRCKDCKYQKFYDKEKDSFYCDQSGIINYYMGKGEGDFFCSYEERREE